MLRYMKFLLNKTKKYDKKASNPFISNDFQYNPFKSIYEQTYIWVEKESVSQSEDQNVEFWS